MQAIQYLPDYKSMQAQKSQVHVIARFMEWIKKEEKNHIAWVGASIMVMSAVFFPITITAILLNGAIFTLVMGAVVSLAGVVITNLAALPTKYTIPALMMGILMDIVLIVISFVLR
jgi:hypothetical protein